MGAVTKTLPVSKTPKIRSGSKLNNFDFRDDGIKGHHAYGIGDGKDIKEDILTTTGETTGFPWL